MGKKADVTKAENFIIKVQQGAMLRMKRYIIKIAKENHKLKGKTGKEVLGKFDEILVDKEQLKKRNEQIKELEAENKKLREAFGLARNMILSGEKMTSQAEEIFEQALKGG